jgi:hypothetical protein
MTATTPTHNLEDSTVSHINIDKSTRVQVDIVREVGAIAKAN